MTGLLRRSELAVPASNDNMFEKAASCGADLVLLDLEDAVPPAFKVQSRAKAITALNDIDWGRTARAIRINGLDTSGVTTTSSTSSPKPGRTSTPSSFRKPVRPAMCGGWTCCSPNSSRKFA
ncbi:hypothetical protein MSTO_41830 [Mycobacterium stomatepiae]|uniref:HpcH/HpaI aldolase/citrate lyase domain-containing protein n=1 Tax=Mycobacterium stomatepiae TaxID=470076 RepID=A0A7I7QCD5_9MYCO|nr:hypothetical protein MSTO_41830 [Mycobacterium stomatepiae]